MRKLKLLLGVLLVMAFSSSVFAQFTGDGFKQTVVGTHHDLTAAQGTEAAPFAGTVICEYCHTPHKFVATTGDPPLLWNQDMPTGSYTTYSSPTFDGATSVRDPSTASTANAAAYMSLLCLTCHDGSVAIGDFKYNFDGQLGAAGSATPPDITFGGLANDHPVDFTYSVALATTDGGLQSPTEGAGVAIPYVGTGNLPLFKDASADPSGRLECATCHNPHNDTNMPFLRMDNAGSALCLNCHGA